MLERFQVTDFRPGLPEGLFSNQKIPIWVNFGGPYIGKCLYILWPLGISYGDLGYFMIIWYILYSFGTFFRFWCHVPRKIWQPSFRLDRPLCMLHANALEAG
jgi:hypothetical protein